MLCEKCRKNKATIHLTEIIKNVKSEVHLCENCAKEIGLNSKLSNFSLSVSDFLSFIDTDQPLQLENSNNSMICLNCGKSLIDLKRTLSVNCSQCYHFLHDEISKLLLEIQNNNIHVGKVPDKTKSTISNEEPNYKKYNFDNKTENFEILNKMLNKAIDDERYEDAAIIRDKIQTFAGNEKSDV